MTGDSKHWSIELEHQVVFLVVTCRESGTAAKNKPWLGPCLRTKVQAYFELEFREN